MTTSLLTTKLYIPRARHNLVPRPRLIRQLNDGLQRKLTLISAPAGYGKTTLVEEWLHAVGDAAPPAAIAWLSLDEADNDPARFLSYTIAALRTVEADLAKGALSTLESPQPPPVEPILTALINGIAALRGRVILVLDDYHLIEARPIHDAVTLLLRHMPPRMHLVIATREDPHVPLARLRARGQLTELRAVDLRFTFSEAAEFLNQVMGLDLSADDIAALETRTEGWIAGLQLAAISLRGRKDTATLIKSFTGSHRLVLDYLIEEVLEQQPEKIQTFLLQTAILERLTGSLCDALTGKDDGQAALETLEQANLFIIPLDNERHWYRYHHLFADLLRQRLRRRTASSSGKDGSGEAELHMRASEWYEDNGQQIQAFRHAVAADDVARAARLIEGGGMPLTFRGALTPVRSWLESLPTAVLDSTPLLWVTYASAVLAAGQVTGVEEKLQAAEAALQSAKPHETTHDILGRIAATRATMAWGRRDAETIIAQSRRALEYLHPDNLPFRTSTTWKLGYAYRLQGDLAAASRAYTEAISICQATGNIFINILASTDLGEVQEAENRLHLAAETYRRILQLVGDKPLAVACGAHAGLAHVLYEWNNLDAALHHAQRSVELARPIDSTDAFATCGMLLARLKLSLGDVPGASALLAEVDQFVRRHSFAHQMPALAAAHVLVLLHQGDLAAAAHLAEQHELPISQTRVLLALGNAPAALAVLKPWRRQLEAAGPPDMRLQVMILQAIAHQAHGDNEKGLQLLGDALALAEPDGFIRIFVDEGSPMARLLYEALSRGIAPEYVRRLLSAFPDTERGPADLSKSPAPESDLIEPLSDRELEVLQLIAEGLTNPEIASRLYLSPNTVKVHTRNIYGKLGVRNRTQASARGRALGILPAE